MIDVIASVVVVLAAIYLVGIAAASFFAPGAAARFLNGFASSPRIHRTEMVIRMLVGGSLLVYAPRMLYSDAFAVFGWVLIVTSMVLLLIPWRWHHRFAQKAVRPLTRHAWLFGILALPLGGVMLAAVFLGGVP